MVTNRNSIPDDVNGAWYTSGIRLGTPALTTLGFGPEELDQVADVIATALRRDHTSHIYGQGEVPDRCSARRDLPKSVYGSARPPSPLSGAGMVTLTARR